jgi:hypothetical protein
LSPAKVIFFFCIFYSLVADNPGGGACCSLTTVADECKNDNDEDKDLQKTKTPRLRRQNPAAVEIDKEVESRIDDIWTQRQ